MSRLLRDNGLTVVLTRMFLISIGGMVISGHASHNNELKSHGEPQLRCFHTSIRSLSSH